MQKMAKASDRGIPKAQPAIAHTGGSKRPAAALFRTNGEANHKASTVEIVIKTGL